MESAPITYTSTTSDIFRGHRWAARLPALSYMELILTNRCNMRCSYCFEADKDKREMSEETAMTSVDFLMEYSRNAPKLTLLFFGGEPLIRFDLMEKVVLSAREQAKERGKKITFDMTTNGTLIDEEHLIFFRKNGVKFLLSMDGGREDHDAHRRLRSGKGSFDKIKSKMRLYKRYQPWQGVKMTVTPDNARNLRRNIEELWDIGINQFIVGHAHGTDWTIDTLLDYERSLKEACELYLEKKYKKQYFRLSVTEDPRSGKVVDRESFGCGAGRGRFCVDSIGDLYGCSKLATITGMNNGVLPFGNVYQGLTRIENRLKLLEANVGPRARCAKCEFRLECSGGCPAVNYVDTSSIYVPNEISCSIVLITNRVNEYFRKRYKQVFGKEFNQKEVN